MNYTLAEARAHRGVTLQQLSDLTEEAGNRVWVRSINRIEHGEHSPRARTRVLLAQCLGMTVADIAWPEPGNRCPTCGRLVEVTADGDEAD